MSLENPISVKVNALYLNGMFKREKNCLLASFFIQDLKNRKIFGLYLFNGYNKNCRQTEYCFVCHYKLTGNKIAIK